MSLQDLARKQRSIEGEHRYYRDPWEPTPIEKPSNYIVMLPIGEVVRCSDAASKDRLLAYLEQIGYVGKKES